MIIWLIQILVVAALGWLCHYVSNIEMPESPEVVQRLIFRLLGTEWYPKFYKHREFVYYVSLVLVGLVSGGLPKRRYRKEKEFLSFIFDQAIRDAFRQSDETDADVRVTLFKKERGSSVFLRLFFFGVIRNWSPHRKKGLIIFYLKRAARVNRSHLLCFARSGKPYPQGTSTSFLVADAEHEIDGFVPYVMYKGKTACTTNLPDIRDIAKNSAEKPCKKDREKIDTYMKEGKIRSHDILRSIHNYPVWMWGTAVYEGRKPTVWGVLIVESNSPRNRDEVEPHLLRLAQTVTIYIENMVRS